MKTRTRSHPGKRRPTAEQHRSRSEFGNCSALWGAGLTDQERRLWNSAAAQVRRRPRLTGQRLFIKVNSLRLAFRLELLRLPPPPKPFRINPVGQLTIPHSHGRLALQLAVSSPPVGPILVYASRPCNPGVSVCCKFIRLGLLPPPAAGVSNITQLYAAKIPLPAPGQRLFIRTRYLDNYLTNLFLTTTALVPVSPRPKRPLPPPPPQRTPTVVLRCSNGSPTVLRR